MFLVSTSSRLVLPIRAEKTHYHHETGVVLRIDPAITLQFTPSGILPEWAREVAKGLSGFGRGLPRDGDTIDTDPYARCGVCDVDAIATEEGWDEGTRKFVEARLESAAGSNFAIARPPAATKPWEKYDEATDVDQILYTLDLTGISPRVALRYERENAARPQVVAALEDAIAKEEEDVVGVISA